MVRLNDIFATLNGASFVGIDTEVDVKLSKNMPGQRGKNAERNPHHGRVTKKTIGASVMVFSNKNSNAYSNMVKRRLEEEGKFPEDFQLSPRKWGERLTGMPIVKHIEKDGTVSYYLEVIFLNSGTSKYYLDGEEINKEHILGLPSSSKPSQGGLERTVYIRTYKLDSITKIRADKQEFSGPFSFSE